MNLNFPTVEHCATIKKSCCGRVFGTAWKNNYHVLARDSSFERNIKYDPICENTGYTSLLYNIYACLSNTER